MQVMTTDTTPNTIIHTGMRGLILQLFRSMEPLGKGRGRGRGGEGRRRGGGEGRVPQCHDYPKVHTKLTNGNQSNGPGSHNQTAATTENWGGEGRRRGGRERGEEGRGKRVSRIDHVPP